MPELPEVETIRRRLRQGSAENPPLRGQVIRRAELLWRGTLATPDDVEVFVRQMAGRRIVDLDRRGKYLIFRLDAGSLVFHLRMSGDLWWERLQQPVDKHHRLLLFFSEGRLAFNDTRKFGRVWLLDEPERLFARLGPEPFDPALTPERFFHRLQRRRRQIKPLLLDQGFLAGVGNIYADEALHRAGLHPLTPSNRLTFAQAADLLRAVRAVLQEGIARQGASIDWVYRGGSFQNHFRVYQRAGELCYDCGTPIVRLVVGQRGTHFCPQCQPSPEEMPPAV